MIARLGQPALAAPAAASAPPWQTARHAAVAATLVLAPVAGLLAYLAAQQEPAQRAPEQAGHGLGQQQLEAVVARLQSRLQNKPEDAGGWAMLARTQAVLGRFDQANAAYARAIALEAADAQLLADAADALAAAQGGRLSGEPQRLIERALRAGPRNTKALALAASVAFEQADYPRAIAFWERVRSLVPADSEFAGAAQRNIDEARLATVRASAAPDAPQAREMRLQVQPAAHRGR